MSHSHSPETHDHYEKPISYSEIGDWLADQPNDFTDRIATLVNKNGKNEGINLDRSADPPRKPGVELLARYLHYLDSKGEMHLFEEVYNERFLAPPAKTDNPPDPVPTTPVNPVIATVSATPVISIDPDIPSMEKIISNFDSCCSEPKIDTIKHLESLLAKLQYACEVYSITVPGILTKLKIVLSELKQGI